MEFSFGFLVFLFFVLIPGLIFRRLYFYGEFSKQFNAGHNLIELFSIATFPGLVMLFISYTINKFVFQEIKIAEVINVFKDINSPEVRLADSMSESLKQTIEIRAPKFLGLVYLISFLLGSLTGRLIRITKIDTRLKLLRFKNYWFYVFNGQFKGFKKLKHLTPKNKTHIFTKADVLVDSNNKTLLYTGIVVDYELCENDNTTLSKIYLQNAERYTNKDGVVKSKEIPGTLLVVDCLKLININLTYIYEDESNEKVNHNKIANFLDVGFGLIIILIIPFFIFKSDSFNNSYYLEYFEYGTFKKIVTYLFITQMLSLLIPYYKKGNEYKLISLSFFFLKLLISGIFLGLIYLL